MYGIFLRREKEQWRAMKSDSVVFDLYNLFQRSMRSIWSHSMIRSKIEWLKDRISNPGWEFALWFFCVNSLFFESEILTGVIRSHHSFKKSDGSKCCLLQRARRVMKSNSLFFCSFYYVFPLLALCKRRHSLTSLFKK